MGRPTAGPAQLPNAVGRDEEINPVLGKAVGILRPGSSGQSATQPLGLSDLTYPHRQIYRNGCSVGIELSHLAAHAVHSIGQSADRSADGFIRCMRLSLRLCRTSYPCLALGSVAWRRRSGRVQ